MSADPSNHDPISELALEESAEELYEMAPCGYLTTSVDGRIVKVNRTLTEWLGYERDELIGGRRFIDLLTVGGRIFCETHFNLLLRVQTAVDEIALDIICKDGRVLPALINARQKQNAAGEPVLNRFTIFNSSERRMYERELLAARDLLRTTLSSIGDGVIATDTEGRINFINPVAEELSGWKDDTALGKPIDEVLTLVREDNMVTIETPIKHCLRSGARVGLANHTLLVSRDGRHIPIDDTASPIRDASGNVLGGVLVFRDISERRRAEEALNEVRKQLETQAAELLRSNEDLSRFAYVASHDLQSPLSTINQFAQLLERKYGDQLGDGKQLLGYVTKAAQRMGKLIEDLLGYASVSEDATHSLQAVDANIELRTATENLQSAIDESGAIITHDVLPVVSIDQTNLVRIFQNLIGNAIHYRGPSAPRVHISAKDQGQGWLFLCKDNGIGIAPEYQTQIFEAFKRLHGNDVPGTGIGLAVCKKIIERYKGSIWVESQVEQGSTFFFTLPKNI